MTILLLTQVLPYPPESGPQVKTWNLVKYLAREHAVTLVSFVRGDADRHVEVLRRYCRAVHTVPMRRGIARDAGFLIASLLGSQPFMMRRDDRAAMRNLVDRVAGAEAFDAVHADQLNMAAYALRVARVVWVGDRPDPATSPTPDTRGVERAVLGVLATAAVVLGVLPMTVLSVTADAVARLGGAR